MTKAQVAHYIQSTYPDAYIVQREKIFPIALIRGKAFVFIPLRDGARPTERHTALISAVNVAGGYAGTVSTILDVQAILEASGVPNGPPFVTIHDLSQLFYLKKEYQLYTERLTRLKAKESPKISNTEGIMVSGSRSHSRVEDLSLEITELERMITAKRESIRHERMRLEAYINSVPDSLTRLVFMLRFVECLPWCDVAIRIGGNNTESSVKKCCYRYIARQRNSSQLSRNKL